MRKYLMWGSIAAIGGTLLYRKIRRSERAELWRQHMSESEEHYRNAGTRILILGGGFGGLATALQLDQQLSSTDDVSVLVIDRNNDLLFTPLLWTVANGRTTPNNVSVPIRKFQRRRRFHVLHAEIESIDLDQKIVRTSADSRPYDILVIALGSHTIVIDLPGLREHALPFHTPADALQLRNHLIDAIEAAHHTDDPEERQRWLTFVVGGAGDTGVELAAIIHDYITIGLFKEYPWLVEAPIRVILAGRAERVLPMSEPSTSQRVQQVLAKEGIEVLTGTSITAVTEKTVETNAGSIPARTLFWAAGISAPEVVRELPVKHAPNGAILVDNFLRIPGYPNVYVIGDSAWAYDSVSSSPVAPTAQAARQEGNYVGKTIASQYAGSFVPPYQYVTLGHLALLGRHTGVVRVGPITFTGLLAWVFWHMVYLVRNPSWSRRIRLLIDWLLSGLLGRETGQLRLTTGLPERKKVLEIG
jgi:NADH dehydrogenase